MKEPLLVKGTHWADVLGEEVDTFLKTERRKEMLTGEKYYQGKQDILQRKKTVVGANGRLEECKNLVNSRVVDNQYARVVDQKVSYLLGRAPSFITEDKEIQKTLSCLFGPDFHRKLRMIGEDSLNCGIAWLHPYYDRAGKLKFRRLPPWEVIPLWADDSHTELEGALRVFAKAQGGGQAPQIFVEFFTPEGLYRFCQVEGRLELKEGPRPYFTCKTKAKEIPGMWGRVPLIAFRAESREIPLIRRVKSLQDSLNTMLSDFADRMGENAHNTVLVIRNFDGEDLGEFRRNLATFGAVKVRSEGADGGGVETLNIQVNAENFAAILKLLKRALVENAKGFDVKDLSALSSPNQMAIWSMYADMDLDAGMMELEFGASLQELLGFVCQHLTRSGKPGFCAEEVQVIFHRDVLINESETIENCLKSQGILSQESILHQHPWVKDVTVEEERLGKTCSPAFAEDK